MLTVVEHRCALLALVGRLIISNNDEIPVTDVHPTTTLSCCTAPWARSRIAMAEDVTMKDATIPHETELKKDQFTHLPRELLTGIAKQLDPLDLIHLARVNKFLRGIFMDSSAVDVWRAVLNNVNLPPCPNSEMPEPEYAPLMFLKQCTECDEPASRHVDPIFMVRLCADCRKELAVSSSKVAMVLQPMLTKSQFLVPPKGVKRPFWYMRDEYEEVEEKHQELLDDEDYPTIEEYFKTKNREVKEWDEATKPLVEWVVNREKERKLELHRRRMARRAEAEARLINLGWDEADVRDCFYFAGDTKPLINKSKLLDDADWETMLPLLLVGLEKARSQRLSLEADNRRSEREEIIKKWLKSLPADLGHWSLTLRWRELTGNSPSDPIGILCARRHEQGVEKQEVSIQIPSLPATRSVLKWAPTEEILNQDIPTEEFQTYFEGRQDHLKEQIKGWRSTLEASLVNALPETFKPVEAQTPQFDLVAAHIKDSTQSSESLSADLKTLLRADVVFKYDHKLVYYPEAFTSWTIDDRTPVYDPAFSVVARGLLKELQHPDTSYLEMQALGKSFLCKRCTSEPNYLTWKGMVNHFAYEHERWQSASRWNERYREEGGGVMLVFTHDINDSSRPLIQLVAESDRVAPVKAAQVECKVCLSIGQFYKTGQAHIVNHIQTMHLIESPIQGEHYA